MPHFSKMMSMELTPKEANDKLDAMSPSPPMSKTALVDHMPVYPYGLCISLETDQLERLGLEVGECEVGDTVHLTCMAKVTSVSSREQMGGTCDRVELQITDIACEEADEDPNEIAAEDRAKRVKGRYGGKEAA